MDNELRWFYSLGNDQQTGPLSKSELIACIRKGSVPSSAYIWQKDWSAWRPVADVEEFASALPLTPPPLPSTLRTDVRAIRATTPKSVKAKRFAKTLLVLAAALVAVVVWKIALQVWGTKAYNSATSAQVAPEVTQRDLEMLAAERNKTLPARIDATTLWLKVLVGPQSVIYLYQIDHPSISRLVDEATLQDIEQDAIREMCTPGKLPLLDRGIETKVVYLNSDGDPLRTVVVSKERCAQLAGV